MASQLELESKGKATLNERRQWGRFVSSIGEILIDTDGDAQLHADVLDESFGGIGLRVGQADGLEVGAAISLTYDGVPMKGVVRNVTHAGDAKVRVGIEWITTATNVSATRGKALVEERLFQLFRLWQAGMQQELRAAAWQLERDADAHAMHDIVQLADTLRQAVEQGASQTTVCQALEEIVDALTIS
jgi:hypothetical protein